MSATPLTRPVPVSPSLPLPHCRRCDFGDRPFGRETAADVLRDYASRWRRVLTDPAVPARGVGTLAWSPLEHGCHVRDMCLLFHQRLDLTLGAAPTGPAPDGEGERGRVPGLYRDEDPGRVADELRAAAGALARRLDGLDAADWDHEDPRLPGERLTVEFFTRHLLHDIAHDLGEVLRAGG
ncbi:DinB family protein [Streptomyces sp. NPDC058953]|uniref:DinB family protein n=1 Tax=unclassified Streptomyces TaxID=2593676 RepID=UPI0036C1525B